jgi:hypothetical protein
MEPTGHCQVSRSPVNSQVGHNPEDWAIFESGYPTLLQSTNWLRVSGSVANALEFLIPLA